MARLLGLHGWAGSGKDEAAKALVAADWHRDAFADRMRKAILALDPLVPAELTNHTFEYDRLSELVGAYGWDHCKREFWEVRRLLQRFGTEAGRDIHGEDCWIRLVLDPWRLQEDPDHDLVVTDARFPNECQAIRAAGGFVVEIVRPGLEPLGGSHSSEAGVPRDLIDATIVNDSTIAELQRKLLLTVRNLSPA